MTLELSLTQLCQIIDSIIVNQNNTNLETSLATGISTDSRTIAPGEIFVALRGENFDGHKFLAKAVDSGAIALIVEEAKDDLNIPQFVVGDTLIAYQEIARWWRSCFQIPIIGITGSVGKTTTKELIAAVLGTKGQVLKTEANYNNEIGVPKTLFNLNSHHDYGIIEMAMRLSGEIALLTNIARPTIGVITNVGTAHIGRLGSREAIAVAKCELLANMPANSLAVLNQDDGLLMETAAQFWQGETLTYGLKGGDLCGELIDSQTLKVEEMNLPLPLPGYHNALNYLAALAVGKAIGVDFGSLAGGLTVNLPSGRAKRYTLDSDVIILDETYNAGYESMVAALQLLAQTPGQRRLAVLGSMKELGSYSPQLHRQVGETVKNLNLDCLLLLLEDEEAKPIAEGAAGIATDCFASKEELIGRLTELVKPGDRLLFKASHSVGLDRVLARFLANFK